MPSQEPQTTNKFNKKAIEKQFGEQKIESYREKKNKTEIWQVDNSLRLVKNTKAK